MIWPWLVLGGAGLAGVAALAYWQLVIAEGAYLGPKVVAWTYDLVSGRYDAIKRFEPWDERWFVAGPLLRQLLGVERPLILDVATGTGRLPVDLMRERFRGRIVGLDLSLGMLHQARRKLRPYGDRVDLVWQDASRLPFADETFDAVACLESLEFMPRPLEALAEMVRVLAPGGILFITNRVGREARLLPGRAIPRPQFKEVLAVHALVEVKVLPWQVNYDRAIARKAGPRSPSSRRSVDPVSLVRCPVCGGGLERAAAGLSCGACEQTYSIRDGIVRLAAYGKRGTR